MIPVSSHGKPSPGGLSEPEQRTATRLCVETGILLLQHGAESALVETVTRRLGLALGVERMEIAILANAIVVTSLSERHCITTVRRNVDRGVNMHMVTEVQRAMLDVEAGRLKGRRGRAERARIDQRTASRIRERTGRHTTRRHAEKGHS